MICYVTNQETWKQGRGDNVSSWQQGLVVMTDIHPEDFREAERGVWKTLEKRQLLVLQPRDTLHPLLQRSRSEDKSTAFRPSGSPARLLSPPPIPLLSGPSSGLKVLM